ncbi:hypothetical protein EOD39_7583 [Acipenser ruthenus]|uniref:Uncharacterized protein n=1 Tax=Acipenser ruthenus TaxID=7906 RepID=A0A444U6E1_ACIRT|nr:hypothetical protein EOD39_7583 [Acipenser ruthenus]
MGSTEIVGPFQWPQLANQREGEGPERADGCALPMRTEDRPETVPRSSEEGPKLMTEPTGLATYAKPTSTPPKSRVRTVHKKVPPPVSPSVYSMGSEFVHLFSRHPCSRTPRIFGGPNPLQEEDRAGHRKVKGFSKDLMICEVLPQG